jgi:hypothetical protein
VKTRARITVCGSQLRQWGIAYASYSADNRQQAMETSHVPGIGLAKYPNIAWIDPSASGPGELGARLISTYIGGVDFTGKKVSQPWFCPSNLAFDPNKMVTEDWLFWGEIDTQYNYFARVSKWSGFASTAAQAVLMDNDWGSDKVMMADQIFRRSGPAEWTYNHGTSSPSTAWVGYQANPADPGPPNLSGANELYADGHAIWKDRRDFDTVSMQLITPPATVLYVNGGGSSRSFF